MRYYVLLLSFSLFTSVMNAQKIATLEIELPYPTAGLVIPAHVDLNALTKLDEASLSFGKVQDGKVVQVPFQVKNVQNGRELHWLVDRQNETTGRVVFQLSRGKAIVKPGAEMMISKSDSALTLQSNDKNLLRYQFEKVEPPAGVDPSYGRSGFIHPLWSPKGQVLTRIQPPDHYHHYGIWNPWTHVLYEGDTIDFWNLNKKEGTVRFAKFLSTAQGLVYGEYQALHEHVVLKADKNAVALNEMQGVRIYEPANRDYYIADITIDMSCAGTSPFRILEYRYAGLGWRATEKWDNKNSEVLTSENKTRKDADGSTARWCLVQGAIDNEYAGVVMLSHLDNYNHPEPLRIWPENQYGRGDMFASFSPTKNRDWELLPGKNYKLQYRLVVFNGKFDREKSEAAWQYFAHPLKVSVKKN